MYYRKQIICLHLILGLTALVILFALAGCGDFFSEKPVELQTQSILRDLNRVKTVPEPNVSIPDVYKAPPKILEQNVGGGTEFKLIYFCKFHTSDVLKNLIHEQFATELFDQKGKSTQIKDYTVSSNAATNQLIVRCPAREDIDAVLEVLKSADIPPIQVKIDCIISEIYADKTMDWETTLQIQNLLGESFTLGGKTVGDTLLPAFPGAALRDAARSRFGLKVGYSEGEEGHILKSLVDLLESKGYLKILMNPSLEVVNGKTAKIMSSEHVPLQTISINSTQKDYVETKTEYKDVVDSLQVTPHVFADGTIGLETSILLGAKSIPEGVKQTPIVTKRQIDNKENRIREGESLVIGGIRKVEERAVIRGVPFLKDIPLLRIFFSSKDFEERGIETVFILTPTISTGGIPNRQMVEKIREKRKKPEYEWELTDPLGLGAYTEHVEEKAEKAEFERFKAELDKAAAEGEVDKVKDQLLKTAEEVMGEKAKAMRARAKALKAQKDAQKAKAEAEEVKKTFLKAQQEAKAAAEKEKAKAEQVPQEKPKEAENSQPPEETEQKNTSENAKQPKNDPTDPNEQQ